MKYLLDTHTILWGSENSGKLSNTARDIINDKSIEIYVSISSLWEFSIKYSMGKLKFEGGLSHLCEVVEQAGFIVLPITQQYLAAVIDLPFIHRDPFDRLLIATAKTDGLTILTSDEHIPQYDVLSAW